jgi:hypothetical protein
MEKRRWDRADASIWSIFFQEIVSANVVGIHAKASTGIGSGSIPLLDELLEQPHLPLARRQLGWPALPMPTGLAWPEDEKSGPLVTHGVFDDQA